MSTHKNPGFDPSQHMEVEVQKDHEGDKLTNPKEIYDISVNDIENRVCYFSLAGDQALNTFAKYLKITNTVNDPVLENEVTKRLYFAIIMFDVVIVHCSDPLRSQLIKTILEKHIEWIKSGRIRFIANSDITDWKKDYDSYITRKHNQYREGYYAMLEAQSLTQPFMTDDYKQGVKELLSQSPYYIRKDDTISSQFTRLLREDIKHNHEYILINRESEEDNSFESINKYAIEKTVFQLLNARYYEMDTPEHKSIFKKDDVNSVFREVRQALDNQKVVARPGIVEAIRKKSNSSLDELQEVILDAVTLRMDLMYCRMNAGKQLILEFHPSYEKQTLYRLQCFDMLLTKLWGLSLEKMSPQIVNALIENKDAIGEFRRLFLASMADTHEQNTFIIKEWTIGTVFKDRLKRILTTCNEESLKKLEDILK